MSRKRCSKGKSCGATCIYRRKMCLMTLEGNLVSAILSARAAIRAQVPGKRSSLPVASTRKIDKLVARYQSLPQGDPLKEELRKKIRAAEMSRARNNAKEQMR